MASQGRELANHFQSEGTPIMIGKVFCNGEYVKLIVNVNT